jgi:serine/threonine protein kinase
MAPEQLEGREADARTDIWALGCVLFEMLAGRRAFEGDSQAGLIAAIEKDDVPSVALHRPAASPALARLVRQCLMKDPEERRPSARDVAFALQAESDPSRSRMEPAATTVRPPRRWLAATAIGLPLLLAGAGVGLLYGRKLGERPLPKMTQLTFRRGLLDRARFTPDGKTVVYSAFGDGNPPELTPLCSRQEPVDLLAKRAQIVGDLVPHVGHVPPGNLGKRVLKEAVAL